jgi:hypothetical protein
MTNEATPVSTGGDAQPIADARIVDNGLLNAGNDQNTSTFNKQADGEKEKSADEGEITKLTPEQELEKLRRAKSRDDRRIGKLTAIRYQNAQELQEARDEIARLQGKTTQQQTQQQPAQATPDGMPKEANYKTYAEYLEAVNDYKIDQKFAKLQEGQQQTQQKSEEAAKYQAWENERLTAIDSRADAFAKDYPEVKQLFDDNAELIKSYPPELKRAFLEADKPEVAFYNLATQDKLADLADMSIVDAKVEIRLAQMQAPKRLQTKAPAPLPASRGSVPAEKDPADMTDAEWNRWRRAQIKKNNTHY